MNAAQAAEEAVRYMSLRLVLAPAAAVLPKKWAIKLGQALVWPLLCFPQTAPRLYWQLRATFGTSRLQALRLLLGWLGLGYRDFVVSKRVLQRREDLFAWKIEERNTEGIDQLRRSNESYIIATGHFGFTSSYGLFAPSVTWGHAVRVVKSVPAPRSNMATVRLRYQFRTHLKAGATCWRRRCELVAIGSDLQGVQTLYDHLSQRGNAVVIDVDAWWEKSQGGSYERAYAGRGHRVFATGAVELARLTHCPIISCVHWLEPDGTVVLDWGTPIRIADPDSRTDQDIMDVLLDRFETAIGNRPMQFAFEIGADRRWNAIRGQWEG